MGEVLCHDETVDVVVAVDADVVTEIQTYQDKTSTPLSSEAVINLDHGDPTMFEAFWKTVGQVATLVIPGWQAMSYFSDVTNVCWFLEPKFSEEVQRLHKLVGNAAVDGKHIVVGTGSTQLFQAALFALSDPNSDQPTNVVSAVPYYSSYPVVTDYLQSRLYRWAGDAREYKGNDPYIELVCSPNNPDGFLQQPVVRSANGKTVHDLAYYWPQYVPIRSTPEDHDIMLFTVSKSTGHAGTRIGWALVREESIARKMTKFIELNTIGVSKDSQLRAAKILSVVTDSHDLGRKKTEPATIEPFFQYGRRTMTERWRRLREAVGQNGVFSLPEFPSDHCKFSDEVAGSYPAFAWMKSEKEEVEDGAGLMKENNILTRCGKHFGTSTRYFRVSMLDRDPSFDLFIQRILAMKKMNNKNKK